MGAFLLMEGYVMTKPIEIEIKRSGFPVKIGSLELWFDQSLENIKRFSNLETIAYAKLKEAEENEKHVHFPEEGIDEKAIDAQLDADKEFIAIQYDIMFGDGTFKKIYKNYPDVLALADALDPIGFAIAERIEENEKERSKIAQQTKVQFLNKKASKKK